MSEAEPIMLPELTPDNIDFWQGGRDGHLVMFHCQDCGLWIHPSAPICRRCLSRKVGPQPTSGRGVVASYTINHQPWIPGLKLPYVVAIVQLEEQADLRLMTNMPRTPIDQVRVGLPVTVYFEQQDAIYLPLFEAA